MRAVVLGVFAACGGNATHAVAIVPPPAPDAAMSVDAAVAIAPPDAPPPRDCWTGTGPILRTIDASAPSAPVPVSAARYPLRFPILDAAEQTRRAAMIQARYPELEAHVDDLGVVTWLSTARMPCDVADDLATRGQLTMASDPAVHAFIAELAREVPDVPFLAHYGVQAYGQKLDAMRLSIRQFADVPEVLTAALPKDLDDAALAKLWSKSRVQWFRLTKHERRLPMPECHGCQDPPGPRIITTYTRQLKGARPIAGYLDRIERRTYIARPAKDPKTAEVRRAAHAIVDDLKLEHDLFGASSIEGEYPTEVVISTTDQRDAITGDPLPATPPEHRDD